MNCGIEFGKCDICGKECGLERTYFEYDINCECHSPKHFELVRHCKDCVPSIPTEIHPYIKAMDGKSYRTTITNILPIRINGEFIITEPIIKEQIMTQENFKSLIEAPYNYEDRPFVKYAVARTVRLVLENIDLAKEWYDNLPKAVMDNEKIPTI